MKLRLPALNFRANLLPLFLRTRRIPILPTMLLLICLIAMTGRSFAAQLELDLLKDPGGLANAIHVWEFQADGSQVQQMTGGNTFSSALDGLTGSLTNEGAAGFFTVTISSVDNFDEVNFTNTLSDISGDKWAYNSAEANYGTKTPTDPLIQIQPGEAMLMTFDLSNLTLPSGKQLYVNGFKVQNGFTNSPGGQRISYLENGATNAVQLTGDSGEQNALVGGDDVIQPVGQSVDTGDQIAIWATSNFGQKRFVGFRFSVRQTVVLNTDDSGPGSLRQVLIDATSGDTITFDSALSGSTILLTSGQILIDKNIDIDASAVAGGISIDGNANGRIFEITAGTTSLFENLTLTNGLASGTAPNNYGGGILVKSGAVLTINSSTLSGNTAAFGGGILSSGMLTVNHSTLSSNTAVSSCGGIYNLEGTLIVNHSTLSGNTADALGGGIRNYNATGSVSINHSTLSGNKANTSRGGGIYNNGTLTLNSSTLSENTAYTYGGGIFNTSIGTLTLQNSTLSANTADDIGGGIRNNGGTLNSTNSIVADNMAPTGTNVYGSINSDVNNLTSGDPQLAPLGDYGGPTQTMPTLPGSPAIDAGAATTLITDQRGLARVVNGIVDIGAVEYQAGTRYVDASNLNPISPYTTWATAATNIQDAVDAALPADLVLVTNGVYATGGRLAAGLLLSNRVVIDKAVNVQSVNGPEVTVIEGAGPLGNSAVRCVWLADGASLEGFTLTNGATRTTGSADDRFGGGVYAQSTQGVVSNCTLTGNSAHYGGGGAYKGTLNNCVLSGNSAVFTTDSGGGGGALYSDMNDCILSGNTHVYVGGGHRGGTLNRCTLTGNSAQYGGGSYYSSLNAGEVNNSLYVSNSASLYGGGAYRVKLNNCTLVNNDAVTEGGGAAAGGSNGWLKNCIVYNNTAPTGPNLGITGTYAYTNVTYSCTTPLPAGAGNIDSDPQLAPLGNYGGPTQTMPPLPGSPAIDAGLTSATNSLTDQRGFTRVVGSDVDMGSVESGNAIPGVDYTVTTSINDFPNGLDPAEVTLRDAIAFATNGTTITFDAALSGSTILLTSGQILIDKNIDIDASALAGGITIDGNGLVTSNRIFEITAGTTNVFDSLTLINGLATADSPANRGGAIYVNSGAHLTLHNSTLSGNSAYLGGGIYNLNSTLTLHNSTLSGNLATFGGGIFNIGTLTLNSSTLSGNSAVYGGGIYNYVGGTLTLHNSTLSGNSASFDGGGIFNYGTLTLHNSTLSDNAANTSGGGIFNIGTLTLNSSTLSGNSASFDGGGIYNNGGTLNSTNSIVADNMAPTGMNVFGSINSDVNNLTIGDPQLAPLGDYGGPTQTMPPLPGSPAIDAGAATTLITDQRGAPRFDGLPDIGAVEAQAIVLNTDDNGPGSLRNAVAYGGYTPITFTNTLSGSTILLTSGQILIDKNLDIDASALAGGITIDGNGSVTSNRIFEITAGTTNVFDSLTLTNGLATGSFPANSGGAIYVNSGAHLTITNSTLSGNLATYGGGIFTYEGTLTLNSSTLSGNSASFDGGGIYNSAGGTLTLHNSTLSGNSASFDGGGIFNYGTLTLHNSTLSDNAANTSGGGIFNIGTLTLNSSTLSGNTASNGGGIRNNGGTLTLHNSTLSGNTSTGFRSGGGGGIYNIFGGTLTLHNSTLSGNTANNYGGGGIVNDYGSTLTLHNSTLSGNTADFHGGIANYNGTLTLNNSTLSGNTANYGGGGIANGGTLNITNTIVAGNRDYAGFKNFSGNISSGVNNLTNGVPLLAPLGDYGGPTQTMPPLPGSPAIDAGGTTTNTTDQRGLTREVNAAVDIGAVEIQGASDTDSIIAAAWSTDADSDGNAFGVEFALGTDWNTSDGTNTANLAALSAGGAAFGFNPAAVPNTAWVLKRSLDLVTDPFVEIYRYDGPTDTTTTNLQVSITTTAFGIEVQDQSGATNAFYQFEAEVSP